jgi:serine protein kinase
MWKGSFLDYLEKVREDPTIPKLAHARLYDLIIRTGSEDLQSTDDAGAKRLYKDEPLKTYNFFRDEFRALHRNEMTVAAQ